MEAIAKLNKLSISPRKVRLVADLIRKEKIKSALFILKYSRKKSSVVLYKLLKSAMANWEQKNPSLNIGDVDLGIVSLFVDSSAMLKRVMPAAQGRGKRIRKRRSNVTVVIDALNVSV